MFITTPEEIETAVNKMTEDQRRHLRIVISELIQCYLNDDIHGMVLVGRPPYEPFKIMAVNTNEMDAAELLSAAREYINGAVMEDAPPKEKFN
jgi:hypothetical protein